MGDYTKIRNEHKGGTIKVMVPDNVEMGGQINRVELCRISLKKRIFKYLLYILTGGFMYLLGLWIPKLKNSLTYTLCDIDEADWIIVYGADKDIEVLPLVIEKTSKDQFKIFMYRFFKYFYDATKGCFMPAQFSISHIPFRNLRPEFDQGLDVTEIQDKLTIFGRNITDIPLKSCFRLLMDEVLTPFYIFQVFSFVAWSLDNYLLYCVIIFVFSAISILFAIVDTMRTTRKLHSISYYEIEVFAWRKVEGTTKRIQISSSSLVPGDILEIPEGVLLPCEAVLINGTAIMNESMLTGESIPVIKNAVPDSDSCYSSKEDKQYTLYSGTKCIQARSSLGKPALGLVVLTGFATVKGDLIRTMMFPKPSDFEFYYDSFRFIGVLAIIAMIGNGIDLYSWIPKLNNPEYDGEVDVYEMLLKAAQIITVTVPPALPTCMQVGISVALQRLKKAKTYCISPNKINEVGRVNIMCFDKTGTLTEDGLDVLGVRPVFFDKNIQKLGLAKLVTQMHKLLPTLTSTVRERELKFYSSSTSQLLPSELMFEAMATCHSLTSVGNQLIGDPLDVKMFQVTNTKLDEEESKENDVLVIAKVKDGDRQYGIVRRFEFSSKLQRMSVIVKAYQGNQDFRMHIKGSPEKIEEMCIPDTVPHNFQKILIKYTEDGYRVLALASKIIPDNYATIMNATREEIEKDFIFMGFLIVENRLKPITSEIIKQLHEAEVETIMVTGDNILTAISVAKQCEIIPNQLKVISCDMGTNQRNETQIIWKDVNTLAAVSEEEMDRELNYESEDLIERRKSLAPVQTEENSQQEDAPNIDKLDFSVMDIDDFFAKNNEAEYCLAVSGKAFSHILGRLDQGDELAKKWMKRIVRRCLVFARMQPDEKAGMIKRLQLNNKQDIIGMCGDGANDCAALKTAHVGVSLSEAEASIAAPFTSKQQDISCIPNLLKEGRAALSVSYQTFKYMALYSMIQFIMITILYYEIIEITNWAYYHQDIFAVLPFSSFMALSGTAKKLSKYKPVARLMSYNILSSVIGQIIIQGTFQAIAYFQLIAQPDITTCDDSWDTQAPCMQNTVIYIVGSFQLGFVAWAFLVGRPFRKSFYTNFTFTGYLVFYILFTAIILYNPYDWAIIDSITWPIPLSWKNYIFIWAMINGAVTMLWDKVIVKYTSIMRPQVNKEFRNSTIVQRRTSARRSSREP